MRAPLPSLAFGALTALLLLVGIRHAAASETDKYCSKTGANVVLYLDVTTPYDEIDRASLTDGVVKIFKTLGDGDRFSIRTVADAFPNSRRLVDDCIPYCPSRGFISDLFSDCTEGVVIDEKRRIQHNIVEQITTIAASSSELKTSEIIRTISMSAGEEYRSGQKNVFYIFSDMIENSAYMPSAKFLSTDNNKLMSSLAKDQLVPNLQDATVKVFGIGRGGSAATRNPLEQGKIEKILDFWETYFSVAGASVTLQPNLGSLE
jgi:hypothetical protein